MAFWGHLGSPGAVLEASWGRLDGVLGRLGVLGDAYERPTIVGCLRAGPRPESTRPSEGNYTCLGRTVDGKLGH